jgi:hypothetical protein
MTRGDDVISLGVILLLLGWLLNIGILTTLGIILLVVGAVLFLLGAAGREIGERHPLEHRPQVDPDRDPHLPQTGGGARIAGLLGGLVVDVGQRPLDRPDNVRDADLGRSAGEPVAAAGAALGLHQPRPLQLEQDLLEELQRDPLRLGEHRPLDRGAVRARRELERRPHRVVRLRSDSHCAKECRTRGIS